MHKVVFVRHGESVWNKKNIFTGWIDVSLSKQGIKESEKAARLLKKHNFDFDIAFTSVLKRAIETLDIIMNKMDLDIPVKKSWRLNERHYGALEGLSKTKTKKEVGEEQVHLWRRSFKTRPPALKKSDERYPGKDPKYSMLRKPPVTESLQDTLKRTYPYWKNKIVPEIKNRKKVLVVAHGNSFRAIIKKIENISDKEIPNLEIPTGLPLVYEFNNKMEFKKKYYLK